MVNIPKRNKSKDNPYILGFDEIKNTYTVEFVDNLKVIHKIEISEVVYQALDKFELEDVSQMHKYSKHIEHSEIYDETLNKRAFNSNLSLEERIENKLLAEELKDAINKLSDTQKRRLKLYYFENKNLREIAELEHCSIPSAKESIDNAIKKLKKILKN